MGTHLPPKHMAASKKRRAWAGRTLGTLLPITCSSGNGNKEKPTKPANQRNSPANWHAGLRADGRQTRHPFRSPESPASRRTIPRRHLISSSASSAASPRRPFLVTPPPRPQPSILNQCSGSSSSRSPRYLSPGAGPRYSVQCLSSGFHRAALSGGSNNGSPSAVPSVSPIKTWPTRSSSFATLIASFSYRRPRKKNRAPIASS